MKFITSVGDVFGTLVLIGLLVAGAGVLIPVDDGGCGGSSREPRRQSDLKNVQAALESFRRTHGQYPDTRSVWRGDMMDHGGYGYDEQGYIPGLIPHFLPMLPKDPDSQYPTATEGYMYRSNGTDYKFVQLGTPEKFHRENPYLDPVRPHSWQVSSAGARDW